MLPCFRCKARHHRDQPHPESTPISSPTQTRIGTPTFSFAVSRLCYLTLEFTRILRPKSMLIYLSSILQRHVLPVGISENHRKWNCIRRVVRWPSGRSLKHRNIARKLEGTMESCLICQPKAFDLVACLVHVNGDMLRFCWTCNGVLSGGSL